MSSLFFNRGKAFTSLTIEGIIFDLDDTILATSQSVESGIANLPKPFPGMAEILQSLKVPWVVVTHGDVFNQSAKIANAKLPIIPICCNCLEDKKDAFVSQIDKWAVDARRVMVVGDKIWGEIRYGNELGCSTVRTRFGGRHDNFHPNQTIQIPHFSLGSPEELKQLFSELKLLR